MTFQVDTVSKKRRQVPQNRFMDSEESTETAWQVALKNDQVPNRYIDLWYEEEADARKFPTRKSMSLVGVFGSMGDLETELKVRDISKEKRYLGQNRYTDKAAYSDAWAVRMTSEKGEAMQQADLWYDNEYEARRWSFNYTYTPIDVLRTFKILVTFYPEDDYVATYMPEGFFDAQGYHQPGVYPAGHYPAGYFTGRAVNLEPPSRNLTYQGYIIVYL